MKNKFLIVLSLAACAISTADAQITPLDTAVRTGKLANGFTYFIRHNEEPKNRVVMYLVNKVGSILETDEQRGLAHFMEHMSFNGTTHFPKNELVNYLQKSGVRFGADINAHTSYDETVYQLPLPSDNPEIVKNGLEIMHDWAHGAKLDPVEIDKERGVVLEEKRLGKGANERIREKYLPVILNNSRYATRLPIGSEQVLNNFKPETLKRFYDDWYRPDLQAIIVVGDINVNQMERTIKTKFADLKNPVNEKPRPKYTVPLSGKSQFIAVTDPEMTLTSLEVAFKYPEHPLRTNEDYRFDMVRQLYNAMLNGRYDELRMRADPAFTFGGAGLGKYMGGLDAFRVYVYPYPGNLERGFKTVWRESERVIRFGFTATELQRAKTDLLQHIDAAVKEKKKNVSGNYVDEYVSYFLNGTPSPGIDYEYKLVEKYLPGISLNEINLLAKHVKNSPDKHILLTAPEKNKASLPTEAVINSWMSAVEHENITPFKDEAYAEKLLKKEPVAGTIVSESKDTDLGITTLALSNGIKVVLKPTSFRTNEIAFTGIAPGGTSLASDADFQSASAAIEIPTYGAGNYNASSMRKYMTGKQMAVRISLGERSHAVNGGAANNDLESALQLMYALMTEPRKDSLIFQGTMARSVSLLANRSDDPNIVFHDTVVAVLTNHDYRKSPPTIEKLKQVNLDKAYEIYKGHFANNSGFTFVFVGSIDTLTIKPLLAKYIAGLPVTGPAEEAKDPDNNIPPGVIERTVYKGKEEKATVSLVFSGPFDYSYANAQKMDALKETLQIRLLERLREDESGVYSPRVTINTIKLPVGRFTATVSFGCAPQNADKLIASTLDEVAKIKTDGPLSVNLDKFKAENRRSMEVALNTNGFWLNYLSSGLENHEPLNRIDSYLKQLDALTPEDVKAVANQYLTGKNYIKLVLLPERKNTNDAH